MTWSFVVVEEYGPLLGDSIQAVGAVWLFPLGTLLLGPPMTVFARPGEPDDHYGAGHGCRKVCDLAHWKPQGDLDHVWGSTSIPKYEAIWRRAFWGKFVILG